MATKKQGDGYELEWREREIIAYLKPRLLSGMKKATAFAAAESAKLLNRGQPTAATGRYQSMGQGKYTGGKVKAFSRISDRRVVTIHKKQVGRGGTYRRVGLDPSLPGEPPKKVTARLFQSVAASANASQDDNGTRGSWGSNVAYARALELGFTGRDSIGRQRTLLPRPYLRPVMAKHKQAIRDLIFGDL